MSAGDASECKLNGRDAIVTLFDTHTCTRTPAHAVLYIIIRIRIELLLE